jgi:two-component system C4-dicarboxylate transport sensor histidine kinase DctB
MPTTDPDTPPRPAPASGPTPPADAAATADAGAASTAGAESPGGAPSGSDAGVPEPATPMAEPTSEPTADPPAETRPAPYGPAPRAGFLSSLRKRLAVAAILGLAVAGVWFTNAFLSDRVAQSVRSRAEVRLALHAGSVTSALQRASVVPLLLARDPALVQALTEQSFQMTSQALLAVQDEIGAASIHLLDATGRTVASTDRYQLGTAHAGEPSFVDALRSSETVFSVMELPTRSYAFAYSRSVLSEGKVLGVVVVAVDLSSLERDWAEISDAIAVLDSSGTVILATEPQWRGQTLRDALEAEMQQSAFGRILTATSDWTTPRPDAYVAGEPVMRAETKVRFRGWRIVSFTTYDSIREKVNAVLALEIMGAAILLAAAFYVLSRRARSQTAAFRRESAELRQLNLRLQREIAEREKAQKDLAVAEQTLAQSSKLAALGEMSASVSHELNQPLAAMKTYLAGARLLLQRRRPDEALSSFQRIDDLIERMGAITRQLKSYARKGGEAFEPVDLRYCVSSALSMMEPQLRTRTVKITRAMPRGPVMIRADRIRLEQVIINLLRNALDATKERTDPQIDILLTVGETAVLTVRDNGHGIKDLVNLFEPFYTTKAPGEGVGLGLAISSGIVNDLGGRLTARNAQVPDLKGDGRGEGKASGGAVFEIQLPLLTEEKTEAAE